MQIQIQIKSNVLLEIELTLSYIRCSSGGTQTPPRDDWEWPFTWLPESLPSQSSLLNLYHPFISEALFNTFRWLPKMYLTMQFVWLYILCRPLWWHLTQSLQTPGSPGQTTSGRGWQREPGGWKFIDPAKSLKIYNMTVWLLQDIIDYLLHRNLANGRPQNPK